VLVASATFALWFAACSSTAGPLSPEPLSKILPGAGIPTSQTRSAVIDFLHAYANAGSDDGAALQRMVFPHSIASLWAAVIQLQEKSFPGSSSGTASISSIGAPTPAQLTTPTTQPVEDVLLQATVTFKFTPNVGQPTTQTRTFDGPMTLIESSPGSWQVVDFVRNGQPLGQVLASVGTSIGKEGVTLHVLAEIFDSQIWELIISVDNATSNPVALGNGSVFLAQGSKAIVTGGEATQSLADIPPGSHPIGIVSVPAPASPPSGLVFVITVTRPQGSPIQFALSVDKLRQILQKQSGAPSPSPNSPFG
jgi:hypothetical protein